jgi:hypothetical protein
MSQDDPTIGIVSASDQLTDDKAVGETPCSQDSELLPVTDPHVPFVDCAERKLQKEAFGMPQGMPETTDEDKLYRMQYRQRASAFRLAPAGKSLPVG